MHTFRSARLRSPKLRKKLLLPNRTGFTLIELLLTVGIIALLLSVVIGVINPAAQLANTRNTQRNVDMRTIMESYSQYAIDHLNRFQPFIADGKNIAEACQLGAESKKICKFTVRNGTDIGECGHADVNCIYSAHLSGAYLIDMYMDPQEPESIWEMGNEALKVNYAIKLFPGTYRLHMTATNPELGATVEIGM